MPQLVFQRLRRGRTSAALRVTVPLALFTGFVLAATPATAWAQEKSDSALGTDTAGAAPPAADTASAPSSVPPVRRRLRGAWVGAAFNSPAGKQLGMTPDRDFFLLGLRTTWLLIEHGRYGASWAVELYPIAIVTNNPSRDAQTPQPGSPPGSTERYPVLGAGLAPLGLELRYAIHPRVRMLVTTGAGALVFTREVPVPDARRFNFTFDYGAALQFARSERQSVLVGYRYHHLSNAETAARNPGLDANLFYFGLAVHH